MTSKNGTTVEDQSAFTAAYDKRIDEIRAVPDSELVALNIGIHGAITTVLGSLPEIEALGPSS